MKKTETDCIWCGTLHPSALNECEECTALQKVDGAYGSGGF